VNESGQPRVQYVEARRVLLDALTALQPHIAAIVLIGAQAVYLRTTGRLTGYQPFTTDADLVVNPDLLADVPLLGDSMTAAGFTYTGEPGIWEQRFARPGFDGEISVPVDLIVPKQVAPKAGRRGARLPGGHGNHAARKTSGVEGALADHGPVEIASLDPNDNRIVVVNVAGSAALLVSKAFKLGERLDTPERLQPKDAGDVYRLFDATSIADMTSATKRLLLDERSAATTERALGYLRQLFATPRSQGVDLATTALAGVIDAPTVTSTITSYTRELLASVAE
jgi:hypothetical protein